jgi:CheY-like chemotaxis protein
MELKEKKTDVIPSAPDSTEQGLKELIGLMNAMMQSKNRFIDNVNHQVRTLSNAILGFSELLSCDPLTTLQSDYIQEIRRVAQALALVTSSAVDFSKIESGNINAGDMSPLPERKTIPAKAVDTEIAVQQKSSGRILLIDDSPTNRTVLSLLMEKRGLQVSVAADGFEGVKMALDEEFDLILMDIHMPGMNGYEAEGLLRKNGFKSPIIAMSASDFVYDDNGNKQGEFDEFITKPIDGHKLYEVITQLI